MIWLTGNPVLAYNTLLLLSFPLSAMAAYSLCLSLTGRRDAGFLGGLGFAFAPYRAAQLGHLQVLLSFWMPLVLLGLHGYARTGRTVWLVLFAGAWVAQGLCNGYYLLFVAVLLFMWLGWFATRGEVPVQPLLVAIATAALLLLPGLAGYRDIHERLGLSRDVAELQEYSADWGAWLRPPSLVAAAQVLPFPDTSLETWLFPGFTLVLLVAVGLALGGSPAAGTPATRGGWPSRTLALAAGLFAGALLSAWSLSSALALGGLCTAAALLAPRIAAAWRAGSTLAFYSGATLALWALCLGPAPRVPFGEERMVGPYALLLSLPGFDALRAVARLAMPASLCLSVAAALGVARWLPPGNMGRRSPIVALIASAILLEGWILELPVVRLPERSPLLERLEPKPAAVLELLPGDFEEQFAAMHRAMYHGLPLIGGFSGYLPPHFAALRSSLDQKDPELLAELATLGPIIVRVDETRDAEGEWSRYVEGVAGVRDGPRGGGERLFWIPPMLTLQAKPAGPGRPLRAVRANLEESQAASMIDGKLETRWSCGRPQEGGEAVEVELSRVETIGATVLSLGRHPFDSPRLLLIETSREGSSWSEAWRGLGPRHAYRAALQHPREIPVRFAFPPRKARYVRLRQLGRDPVYYWSVAELVIEGPAP